MRTRQIQTRRTTNSSNQTHHITNSLNERTCQTLTLPNLTLTLLGFGVGAPQPQSPNLRVCSFNKFVIRRVCSFDEFGSTSLDSMSFRIPVYEPFALKIQPI